jgi:hypothetical protein
MLRQRHFRFRTDTGAVDATPTWGAAEDANYVPGSAAFRLRFSIENPDAEATGSLPFQIYVSKNGGAYAAVTTSSTNGIKSIDAGSDADNTTIVIPRLTTPIWTPLAGAAIDLDFQRRRYYSSSSLADIAPTSVLSISRASVGYAQNADGTLKSFGTGTLRITDLGLLVEDARTNAKIYSQDITQAGAYALDNLTVGSNTTAPDGTNTAQQVTENSSTGNHRVHGAVSTAVATGVITASVFIKNGATNGRRYVCVCLNDTNSMGQTVVCDLVAGTITETGAWDSPPSPTWHITSLANGWFRVDISFTYSFLFADLQVFGATSATPTLDSFGTFSYTGDGVSNFYVWGQQVEAGVFPSSYIPTTTTAATRAAENITITGAANSNINAAIASIVAQLNGGESTSYAANIVDSNGTNLLGFDATNHGLTSISASLATANTANRTSRDKAGIAWSAAGRSLVLNGGTVATDATAQTPSATQNLGSAGATANFAYAYIERLTLWTSKLADATLQGFTT